MSWKCPQPFQTGSGPFLKSGLLQASGSVTGQGGSQAFFPPRLPQLITNRG